MKLSRLASDFESANNEAQVWFFMDVVGDLDVDLVKSVLIHSLLENQSQFSGSQYAICE